MKKLNVVTCCFYFALALMTSALSTPALCAGPDWVYLDENSESSFYYDSAATSSPKDGILRVSTRVLYTREGKANALKMLAHDERLAKLHESHYIHDLDCADRESRLLEVTHLDKDGATLKSTNLASFTQWEAIPPDARMDLVADKVCGK